MHTTLHRVLDQVVKITIQIILGSQGNDRQIVFRI